MSNEETSEPDNRGSKAQISGRYIAIGCLGTLLVAVVISLLNPAQGPTRETIRRLQCNNNLKQIGLALHEYHDKFGSFPPPATYDPDGQPLVSWRVLILPCIDLPGTKELFAQFHLDEPWDSQHNLPLADKIPDVYRCPSDNLLPRTTGYVAAVGDGTYFQPHGTVSYTDVKDGGGLTCMVGELLSSKIVWTKPDDLVFDDQFTHAGGFSSAHEGGWQMLMGDGTCRFISEKTEPRILRALMTIAGREMVDDDSF